MNERHIIPNIKSGFGHEYSITKSGDVFNETRNRQQNQDQVNHIDGVKDNNSVENLEWVTNGGNVRHTYKTGLVESPSGEKNSNAKLTEQKVREIRASSKTPTELSKIYGVSPTHISRIKTYKGWKSVE